MTDKKIHQGPPSDGPAFDSDDWRWTAYVLGELDDEDVSELEAIMAASPPARAYVTALSETVQVLESGLDDSPYLGLADTQRAAVLRAYQRPARRWPARVALGMGALAACIVGFMWFEQGRRGDREVTQPGETVVVHTDEEEELARLKTGLNQLRAEDTSDEPVQAGNARMVEAKLNVRSGKAGHTLMRGYGSVKQLVAPSSMSGEDYSHFDDNPFIVVADDPLSTFSVDVDTASYANIRRLIRSGTKPPKDAVRIEELINYFVYDYAAPTGGHPFAVHTEVTAAPWAPGHKLLRIALQGKRLEVEKRPPMNLVFLIDVSGSMEKPNKLPLVKRSLAMLAEGMRPDDRVAIVVYAGASGVVLPSTSGGESRTIRSALTRLAAGGGTNGSAGIELAYKTARASFIKGGINRVILATDGDFNLGTTSRGALVRLIEKQAKSGVSLSILGFGMGNYKDATLEKLSGRGNGNYGYIDTLREARKLLALQLQSTLVTIAKDVKFQLEFNPTRVASYRLIGYENRKLAHRDFNDDNKDAGDIGAGHTVTALYEFVPTAASAGEPRIPPSVTRGPPLRYQTQPSPTVRANSAEVAMIKLRYKRPASRASTALSHRVLDATGAFSQASQATRFAASVAGFGMLLRGSAHRGNTSYAQVLAWAQAAKGLDPHGYRAEFLELVRKAESL